MYDVISCIYNLARIGNGYVLVGFQNPVHSFTYNFDISFYCTSKTQIAIEEACK